VVCPAISTSWSNRVSASRPCQSHRSYFEASQWSAVSDLAASDLGKSVSHSLEALADLERKAQETEPAQAGADQATMLNTVGEYARLVNSVQRWRLVRVCECTTHGRMPMQISAASSRRTSAIVLKAKVAAENGDRLRHSYSQIGEVHLFTLYISRCGPHTRNCAVVGGTTRARREAGI